MCKDFRLKQFIIPTLVILSLSVIQFSFGENIAFAQNEFGSTNIKCEDNYRYDPTYPYRYKSIEPLAYSISNGEFIQLCIEPEYLWYEIYLDSQEPGNLTLTIPKITLDLKQNDHPSCIPFDFTTEPKHQKIQARQISQTEESRTIQFAWDAPIRKISYFMAYEVIGDADYSEHRLCLDNPKSIRPNTNIAIDMEYQKYTPHPYCHEEINLDYFISIGSVQKICAAKYVGLVEFFLDGVDSSGILIFNNTYDYHPKDNTDFNQIAFTANGYELPGLATIENKKDFQTFQIKLLPGTKAIELVYPFLASETKYHSDYSHLPFLEKSESKTNDSSCKADLVPLVKYDKSKIACVKPTTAEILVMRGWGELF